MITTEQHFLNAKGSEGTTQGVIVRLIDGADAGLAWFTDRPFEESTPSAEFIPLLETVSAVHEDVDIFTRRWSYPSITITFTNRAYPCPANADAGKLENYDPDGSGNLWERVVAVRVYVFAGDYAYTSTRWVVRYKGLVNNVRIDANKIELQVDHIGKHYNRQLLDQRMSDLGYATPSSTADKLVPIVLGKFTENYFAEHYAIDDPYAQRTNIYGGVGLAAALLLGTNPYPLYVLCDHSINDYSQVLIPSGGLIPLKPADSSFVAGPPPYRRLDSTRLIAEYFLAHATIPTWTGAPANDEIVTDKLNMEDGNTGTYGLIYDATDDGSRMDGKAYWGLAEDTAVRETWEALSTANVAHLYIHVFDLDVELDRVPWIGLFFGTNGSAISEITKQINASPGALAYTYIADLKADFTLETGHWFVPYLLLLNTIVPTGGDGIPGNQLQAHLADIYFAVNVYLQQQQPECWAACEGPSYPSWMDTRDRAGELVQTPEGIIEYILREYLGFNDTDINVGSFDEVASHNLKGYPSGTLRDDIQAHLNLHSANTDTSDTVFRKLAEQSRFAFCWTAAGKARLMDLSPEKWDAIYATGPDRKVMYGNIVEGSLRITKTKVYANRIVAESRYFQEDGKFHETIIMDNATSQGTGADGIGKVKSATAGWRNIWAHQWTEVNVYKAGSLSLAEFLIGETNNTKALWAMRHNMIEFTTAGYTNADLELGDVIELDATTTDPHQLLFGNSWTNRRFMVTGINQTFQPVPSTHLQAIELYVPLPRGTITGPIDTEEYQGVSGRYVDVVNVRGNIVIAFSKDIFGYGWAYTYTIDAAGNIGAQLDSLEYESATTSFTTAIKVEEGRVLVVFRDNSNFAKAVILDVDSGGNISDPPISTLTNWGGSVLCLYPKICERAPGVFCVVMASTDNDGYMHTLSVDGAGTIKHEDSFEFDDVAAAVMSFSLCYMQDDIIFIADYRSGANVKLFTVNVTAAGVITGLQDSTSLDLTGLSITTSDRPSVVKVADDMMAIACGTSNTSHAGIIVTQGLSDAAGNLDTVRTDYMDVETGADPGFYYCNLRRVSASDTMYSLIHNGESGPGQVYVSSLEIANDGTMAAAILDRAEMFAVSSEDPLRQLILNPTTGLIVAAVRAPGLDGSLVTYKIQL